MIGVRVRESSNGDTYTSVGVHSTEKCADWVVTVDRSHSLRPLGNYTADIPVAAISSDDGRLQVRGRR
jgi:hypothetical protein